MPTAQMAIHGQRVKVKTSGHEDDPLMILMRMASGGRHIWDIIWNDLARPHSVANFNLHELLSRERFDTPQTLFPYLIPAVFAIDSWPALKNMSFQHVTNI